MDHAIYCGGRQFVIGEHVGPAADANVGRDDGGALLMAGRHQLEHEVGDDVAASAIADRVCHHCTLIKITSRSYRLKDLPAEKRKEGWPKTAKVR